MKFPFVDPLESESGKQCIAEARRILTDDVTPHGLHIEVISDYRFYRRRAYCPCRAMAAAAYDWDC